jgi:predicted nucleotidyltransferase component of viral defense system
MILKQEIISLAGILQLQPTTVEKDYVLSWVLYGISQNSKLSEWYFKGGTCLKKCYFETYRFSEDLDFTVPQGAVYSEEDIKAVLNDIADFVYENAGINLMTRDIEVKESINKNGRKTYVAKYTYLGPLNLPSRQQQRIKFDITDDEIIVDEHDMRDVFHLYSDAPTPSGKVRCYSVNEILAEKTRAIYERQGRARDIYDIVNISRNFREHININVARNGLWKKFAFKSLSEPSVDFILSQCDLSQLKAGWEDQLAHQLEVLPPAESFYNDLRPALSWWIDERPIEPKLVAVPHKKGEALLPRVHFPEPTIMQARGVGIGRQANVTFSRYIDQIRYAARNRLCIEIDYHGFKRLVEPYSLRQPGTGNLLLYVFELAKGFVRTNDIRSYKINEIVNAEVKQQAFTPRYVVDL